MSGNLPDGTTQADVDRAASGDEPIPNCEHGVPGDEYCEACDREGDERAQIGVGDEPPDDEPDIGLEG